VGKIASPLVVVLAAAFLVLVIALVRARKLKEEYSVIWVVAAILVLAVALSWRLVELVAPYLGVVYTPSAVFYLAIIFLLGVNLALSVQVSRLERDRIRTAQAVALLEAEVHDLRARISRGVADATDEDA
jgi:hypothetical protein